VAERLYPGTLWGHGTRGLVWNPIFALLPAWYLERLADTSGLVGLCWCAAFLLGYPHAGYTAFELRHYVLRRDGVADARTWSQACFFGAYGLLGSGLAGWYVARGAGVIGGKLSVAAPMLMPVLALAGGIGTAMGLQDVLVMDLLMRPERVLRAATRALTKGPWLWITLGWAAVQLALGGLLLIWL
jgi:hypothetical protein